MEARMYKTVLATACAALIAISASVVAVQAQGKGKWVGTPPGWSKGLHKGWTTSYPPGWTKGKRKGWDGYLVPPGWR
jgi:hypothetical protein